jgi:hypothetical protein
MQDAHKEEKKANHDLTASTRRTGLNALTLSNLHRRLAVIDGRRTHPFLDLPRHGQESLFDIRCVFGRGLEEGDAQAVSEFLLGSQLIYLLLVIRWMPAGVNIYTFATVYSTTFLSDISLLFPTKSLLTPSVAYRSISCSHCLTLLNESISVTS